LLGFLVASATVTKDKFVDLTVPNWAWVALLLTLAAMLGIDLIRHKEAHAPTPKEALKESLIWVACGLTFSVIVWRAFGTAAFTEYLSGYVIEKSLSVDNVFVWSLLFTAMAIPLKFQHRILFWGIFGALALRAIFIFAGTALVSSFWWILVIFGVFLVYTGIKILRESIAASDDIPDEPKTPGLALLKKFMPVTEKIEGQAFFSKINGKRAATPLLAALVVVELTDVIFAVDSVPAILGVSHEPFLVFASNAFAILGLRAMYFLLANAKDKFYYLSFALGIVLIFVGIKMTIGHWVHIPTVLSLIVILAILTAGIVASTQRNKKGALLSAADQEAKSER
jgi:tellurite resistance protein TerC